MTTPSLSWIDREAFDRLVGQVTGATPKAAWQAPSRAPAPERPPSTPPITARIPSLPPEPVKVQIAPFVSPGQGLEANLRALVGWIEDKLETRAAFIADDNGLPVVESARAQQGHMAATSSILLLLGSIRSLMGDMGQWISLRTATGVLHFVEVETSWGRFGVGVLTDGALSPEAQTALERAVPRAFVD